MIPHPHSKTVFAATAADAVSPHPIYTRKPTIHDHFFIIGGCIIGIKKNTISLYN
jgi:hypothetical protein